MSNEIDAVEDFEKQRDEMISRSQRKSYSSGTGKLIGVLLIILVIIGAAAVFFYQKYYAEQASKKSATVLPQPNTEVSRKFDVPITEPEPEMLTQPVTPPATPATVVKEPVEEKQVQLDENGLTPEEAARQRKLKGGFGSDMSMETAATPSQGGSEGGSLDDKGDDADNGLSGSLNTVGTVTVKAFARKSLDLMLTRGSTIPCSLTRAIDSTVPGQITCVTIAPIFSSSGKVILAETGTVFTGNYKSDLQQGRARIAATFDRLETPKHVFMSLRSPAIGPMGEGGVDGEIDTQWGKRFFNSILLATIQDTVAAGTSQLSKGNDGSNVNLNNTSQATTDVASETLKNSINIPAILRKKPGEIINIDVLQDLDFSSVYRIEDEY
ncbi:TrbI/VirB10 family protein [Acinetobacter variabilis]|uniref:TrbI/VirB10 family protein n=1 Tax=Acinetobacter variabilis TaxID=70346 RepID=UPI0028A9D1A9|nr:TrbI/VirB10 family protein [Acinetobacter variabilis]